MKPTEKTLLNRLLAGSEGLSPPDKTEVLEAIFQALPSEKKPVRWFDLVWVRMAVGVAAAAAIGVVAYRGEFVHSRELAVRDSARPTLAMSCSTEGHASACHRGAHLVFKTTSSAALSLTVLGHTATGDRLWYLENVTGTSGVVAQAVALDAQHPIGAVMVDAIFTPSPLTRDQVLGLLGSLEKEETPDGITLVRLPLVIAP